MQFTQLTNKAAATGSGKPNWRKPAIAAAVVSGALVPALAVSAPAMAATRLPAHYQTARTGTIHLDSPARNLHQQDLWTVRPRQTPPQGGNQTTQTPPQTGGQTTPTTGDQTPPTTGDQTDTTGGGQTDTTTTGGGTTTTGGTTTVTQVCTTTAGCYNIVNGVVQLGHKSAQFF